jgi:hypothetical protein
MPSVIMMSASTSMAPSASAFNNFLYAGVGDEKNGVVLTMLSALARQNVDPWDEAADLSRQPFDTAMGRLVSILETLPVQSSPADRTATAERLISLLPNEVAMNTGDHKVNLPLPTGMPHVNDLALVMFFLALMFVGQWVYFNQTEAIARQSAATADAPAETPSLGTRR